MKTYKLENLGQDGLFNYELTNEELFLSLESNDNTYEEEFISKKLNNKDNFIEKRFNEVK